MNDNVKYRVKFTKTGNMIYIGHLDLLKFFQRTTRRAGIPAAYSQGFNPHQLETFAVPLPLGMSSVGEYMDIQLKYAVDCKEIADRFNNTMPPGIEILSVRELKEGEKACAAAVEAGSYSITLPQAYANLNDAVDSILNSTEINIERVVKKKTKITNIRPLIYSLSAEGKHINAFIATGSQANLKPEILIAEIYRLMQKEYVPYKIIIQRQELFTSKEGEFVPL